MVIRHSLKTTLCAIAAASLLVFVTPAAAQTATALLREDDPLPGAPGETVSSLSNPVVNHVGGFGLTVNTTGSGTTLSHIWGNATGGPGDVIITEGTIGDLKQTSFESFHGLSDGGMPCYSASSEDLVSGTTGLDGVWVGAMVLLNEEDPISTLPGEFSTFNSRPGITAEGQPYWVGGFSQTQGGSSQNRALFYGFGITPVLKGGDTVVGVTEPIKTGSSNIDFDYRFSMSGTNYVGQILVDTGSTSNDGVVASNGAAVLKGGAVLREASPVPAAVGGLVGENWDNFDFFGITEGGLMLVTGDTDAASSMDEFVLLGEAILVREGDLLMTDTETFTISGSIEGGSLNEDGDWAVTWDIEDTLGENVEALILNGALLVKEGDAVDLDGDGVVEPDSILANFTGITTLVISDRNSGGFIGVYFTADIDTMGTSSTSDDTEALFRIDVQTGPPSGDEDEDDDSSDDMPADDPAVQELAEVPVDDVVPPSIGGNPTASAPPLDDPRSGGGRSEPTRRPRAPSRRRRPVSGAEQPRPPDPRDPSLFEHRGGAVRRGGPRGDRRCADHGPPRPGAPARRRRGGRCRELGPTRRCVAVEDRRLIRP